MTDFVDRLMVRYLSTANVDKLLVPTGDTAKQRVRSLLASVYEPRLLKVEAIDAITVTHTRFQTPIVQPVTARGTWERLVPAGERALATVDVPSLQQIWWLDLSLDTTISVRVSVTAAFLDGVTAEDVSGLSQQSFVAKFAFLDLAGLMKACRVSSYQELQADFPRLYRLHYADPPAYNPNDPAAKRTYRLRVSALAFPALDLFAALRQFARTRHALDAVLSHPDGYEGGDLLGASAWLAIFPEAAISQTTPTRKEISALFDAVGVVAAFETV